MYAALFSFATVSVSFWLIGGAQVSATQKHNSAEKIDQAVVRSEDEKPKKISRRRRRRRSRQRKNRSGRSSSSSSSSSGSYSLNDVSVAESAHPKNEKQDVPKMYYYTRRTIPEEQIAEHIIEPAAENAKEPSAERAEKLMKTVLIDEDFRHISSSGASMSSRDSDLDLVSPPESPVRSGRSPPNSPRDKKENEDNTVFENVVAPNPAHPKMKKCRKLLAKDGKLFEGNDEEKTEFENIFAISLIVLTSVTNIAVIILSAVDLNYIPLIESAVCLVFEVLAGIGAVFEIVPAIVGAVIYLCLSTLVRVIMLIVGSILYRMKHSPYQFSGVFLAATVVYGLSIFLHFTTMTSLCLIVDSKRRKELKATKATASADSTASNRTGTTLVGDHKND
uniref:Conserved plasma membrane protein n=1 Tax=Steinernema glaseri TaxID=37863 RepID=A0A1I7Z2U3_9BILA